MATCSRAKSVFALSIAVILLGAVPLLAQEASSPPAPPTASDVKGELTIVADTLWVLVTAFLVFFMNLGFGCVEAGFCRAKNATNILGKNFVVFAICSLVFWAVGWGLMFGDGNAYIGMKGWFGEGPDNSPVKTKLSSLIKEDIKGKYKLDLDDKDVKEDKKYEKLLEKIGEEETTAQSKLTKSDQNFKVKLDVPGHGTFEKEYSGKDFYWGIFGAIAWAGVPLLAKFFFQLVFAGTAATIVSGCVAERIHYKSFMVFTVFIATLSYPITGHWIWGGGWLQTDGFWDFAGSTVVHSVGGWAGLAGILLLGSRLGKFRKEGIQPIPGHNMGLAFIGGLVLWFGWFGFNPGSTMAADPGAISRIVITTNLACAAGMISATALAWGILGKPDFSMTVNGALAGLVAITAGCVWVTPMASVIIGGIGGMLAVVAVIFFDRIKIDDPVGALSVHLANGIWGTLAIGLFADPVAVGYDAAGGPLAGVFAGGGAAQLIKQATGVLAVAAYTFPVNLLAWGAIKLVLGLRVDAKDEIAGLDVTEMGMEAYHGFQVSDSHEHSSSTEPRPALVPPSDTRFSIEVEGIQNGELMKAWSELCQPTKNVHPAFKAIYPHMTTVRGNRFNFRSGDPAVIKQKLEELLKDRLKIPVKTTVVPH
jgi:Amt family ammonium transporter